MTVKYDSMQITFSVEEKGGNGSTNAENAWKQFHGKDMGKPYKKWKLAETTYYNSALLTFDVSGVPTKQEIKEFSTFIRKRLQEAGDL